MGIIRKKTVAFIFLATVLIVWLLEASLHYFLGDESSWTALLIDLSPHEIFSRFMTASFFILLVLAVLVNRTYRQREANTRIILNNTIPVCITNTEYEIIDANDTYWAIFGRPFNKEGKIKCYDHRPGTACHSDRCALTNVLRGSGEVVCESQKEYEGAVRYYIVTARPLLDSKGRIYAIIESFQDITDRKNLEMEKEQLLRSLQESLDKVKLLSGLLPICSSCKKIRDDKGYWNQIEVFVRNHSEAEFSHGICPECAKKLYPEYYKE